MNEKIAVSFRLRRSDLALIDAMEGQSRTEKLELILMRYLKLLEVKQECMEH